MGGGGLRGKRPFPGQEGEPSAPSSEAQALGGSWEVKEGMHRFLKHRSEVLGVKAWFPRPLLQLQNPHLREGERRGRGKLNTLLGGQAGGEKSHPYHAPPGAGLSGFLFGKKTQQHPTRQKGEEEIAGLAGPAAAGCWCPYSGLICTPLPGPCPPLAFGKSWAGWLCAPINLPGGRWAGGLGAVCNFAASVAAVPGERAPELSPIGRRCVSWCDLLLSLLAFGHPETNQFDDY